ncbi:MAG: PepSY domain-containing protein, partial [Caulobacterales bacterium]
MSALARLRKFWLDVHLWLGVGLFIPVVLLGLSGAVLVFHDELERALHPQRYAVTAGHELPPSAFILAAKPALGDSFQISAVQFPLH